MITLLLGCGSSVVPDRVSDLDSRRPHIVVLVADDLGINFAPCLTDAQNMPWLNKRCDQALVFTHAYAHPTCAPSRAAMMTGRHPFRTGATDVKQSVTKLQLDEMTIPEIIRQYSPTPYGFSAFGKWHLGGDAVGGPRNPNLQGFDYFSGNPMQHHTYRYWGYEWVVNGEVYADNIETYKTTYIVDRVSEHFQINSGSGPKFYWVGFVTPHLPFHLPPTDLHDFDHLPDKIFRTTLEESNTEDVIQVNRPAEHVVPYYKAMTQALDTEVSRLVQTMEKASDRPLLFILVGDNGDAGEVASFGNEFEVEPFLNKSLRGAKAHLHENGVRIPLMVWSTDPAWEKQFSGTTQRLTHLADLFPTLAELAGVSADSLRLLPHTVDGLSFAGAISKGEELVDREYLYLETGNPRRVPYAYAVVSANGFKLILREFESNADPGFERDPMFTDTPVEFYNLNADLEEENNLFPALCKTEVEQFWKLFEYVENIRESETEASRKLDLPRYRTYVEQQISRWNGSCGDHL